jgi:hypothetical protein
LALAAPIMPTRQSNPQGGEHHERPTRVRAVTLDAPTSGDDRVVT